MSAPYSAPGTRLFVGGLKYNVTKKDLEEFFKKIGQVNKVYLAMDHDRPGGFNRGFAFVEMATAALAAEAIKKLNGQYGPDGERRIGVKLANEPTR